ncbi:uncharacterized protein LOC105833842 isoform X2 [Monomorium pharaonis]|nr:uncharacterized protein LOC105833842 isoform X2 [Monomorium pharaonis]XP_012531328.1 uncharacterized protein LOC105833842 isoform X2 [Monomorium pharaonis]XP_012531329.1 uncharacterized protein LOC105833842 isoform X2 [Monomorium pharaonis]
MEEIDNIRRDRVRRRLFQDNDDKNDPQERENINNHFAEERRIQAEEAKKKWGFDFIRGHPDPQSDRWEWTKIDEQENEISASEETNGTTNSQEECTEKTGNNTEDLSDKSTDEKN